MLTVTKPVYYCEFCKRHRLTANAIQKHEPKCIYNPGRSACGWHTTEPPALPEILTAFKESEDLGWLEGQTDGCPACTLAVVVQARAAGVSTEFDYAATVEAYRQRERSADYSFLGLSEADPLRRA